MTATSCRTSGTRSERTPRSSSSGPRRRSRRPQPALTGGHLQVVLHATRASSLPVNELAAIREYTRAPVILLASERLAEPCWRTRSRHDVADVLLLPQLTDNVVFAIQQGRPQRRKRADAAASARHGRLVTVFSPKGGTGKTVDRDEPRRLARQALGQAGAAARPRPPVRRRRDHARESSRRRRSTTSSPLRASSTPRSSPATRPSTRAGSTILPAPLRPEDAELVTEAKLARLLEVARESYDVIVVDTSPFFHGPMLATLDRTDELLLLCEPGRADAEERPAQPADARAALVPAATGSSSSSTGRTRRSG